MTEESNKPLDIIDKLKLDPPPGQPPPSNRNCPACGARSGKQAGLTHCAYCGHEFTKPTETS
ncbi:hypothetical protein [Chitinophaga sp. 22620]|uniref:hypothetical protein n=1 Tax=Chitinophaga sp. 22620 TaxID=3453952 RepID=UPI003F835764